MRRALLACLFLAACGDDGGPAAVDAPGGGADAPLDGSAPDAPSTCGAAGPAQMMCGTECVDTSSDPMHCGSCTMTCAAGCAAGQCVPSLSTTWEKHFGGPDFGHQVAAVAVDGAGNAYIAGMFQATIDLGGGALTSAGAADLIVASFSPSGMHRWSKRFGSTASDQGAGITVVAGKVYITGEFSGTVDFGGGAKTALGSGDVFVLVLDATTGTYSTAFTFGGTTSDAGIGIVADATGNITVGGFFGPGTVDLGGGGSLTGTAGLSAFVASFSATGTHRWSKRLSGLNANTTYNSTQSLTVDAAGNVTAAGEFSAMADFGAGPVTSAGDFDAFVVSFTPAGGHRWSRTFGASQMDTAHGVAADASGNIVVGGGFHSTVTFGTTSLASSGVIDGWFAILDGATGAPRWAKKLGAASSGVVRDVGVDAQGNAIVSGDIQGAADLGTGALSPYGVYDIFLAGFDKTAGTALFAKRYGGTDYESGNTVAITPGGAMALGGYFRATVDLGTGTPIIGGARDNGYVMMIAR
ncbi:MAG: hypothetical protein JNL83_31150 [Myxococcales bacterium]|nr:hypothetical protein [Myxococcales bacterium]